MPDQDTYPLNRSFLEQRLGGAVGLFQFNPRNMHDRVSASTLAGAVISAANAPLGTLEFDALTVLAVEFAERGDPDTFSLETSLGAVMRKLGSKKVGGFERRDLTLALKHLYDVSLELPEYDQDGKEIGVRMRRLFTELAIYADSKILQEIDAAPPQSDGEVLEKREPGGQHVSRLVRISEAEVARTEVVLAPWFAKAIIERRGRPMDLDTQRRLKGVAKRVWVTLSMLDYVESEDGTYETHCLQLTDAVFAALKLRAARPTDNRKSLEAALTRILKSDPTYRQLAIMEVRRRQYELVVERHVGEVRQAALRTRQRKEAAADPTRSAMAA